MDDVQVNPTTLPGPSATTNASGTDFVSPVVEASGAWKIPSEMIPDSAKTQFATVPTNAPLLTGQIAKPQPTHSNKSIFLKLVLVLIGLTVLAAVVLIGLIFADDRGLINTGLAARLRFINLSSITGGLAVSPKTASVQVTKAMSAKSNFGFSGNLNGYEVNNGCSTGALLEDTAACPAATSIDPLSIDTKIELTVINQDYSLVNTLNDAGVNIVSEYRFAGGQMYLRSAFGAVDTEANGTGSAEDSWVKGTASLPIVVDTLKSGLGLIINGGSFVGAEKIGDTSTYHYSKAVSGKDVPILSAFSSSENVSSWLRANGQFEMWVGRTDHLPKKVKLSLTDSLKRTIVFDLTLVTPKIGEISAPVGASDPNVVLTPDQTRKSELAEIASALAQYLSAKGSYPIATSSARLDAPDSVLAQALVPIYIKSMPSDANSARYYGYISDGSTYQLSAVLDSATDPDVRIVGTVNLYELKSP